MSEWNPRSFLALCQMTAQQSGTIQSSGSSELPLTVIGQTGRLKQIVDFVNEAYIDIQNAHREWLWMQRHFIVDSALSYIQPDNLLEDFMGIQAAAPIASFGSWGFRQNGADIGLSMYLTSAGVAEEGPLRWLDWDQFRETQRRGTQTPGKPQFYSIFPGGGDNFLALSPAPDATYTFRGKYRAGLHIMEWDGDTPGFPAEFHTLVKDVALIYLEGFDEGPRIPAYRLRQLPTFSMLEHSQLPKVRWGAPLA
jgi:hypothetical protein